MGRPSDVQATADDVRTVRPALSRTALMGVLWLLVQSLGGRTATLLSQLVLAWILSPVSFGVVGLVYAVTSLSAALVDFGVDDVLLQREKALRLWTVPAFWTSLGLSLVGLLATIVIASLGSMYYGAGEILSLAIIVGVTSPLTALQMIPTVTLRARMDFKTLSLCNLCGVAAIQVGTVLLALAGAGVYSFVIPAPIVAIVKLVALWRLAPSPVLGRFRIFQVRYLLSSGAAVFLVRLIIAAVSQGDYVVLGLMSSKLEVGAYYFAFKLAAQPILVLAGNFTGVLFPTLVKLRSETGRQVAAAVKAAYLLSYVLMPICFLQAALAGPALRLLFGAKWAAAVPATQILSIGLAFDAVTWITGTLLSANRDYYRVLGYTAVFAPLFFILVTLGAYLGAATGTALGVATFYFVMGPTMAFLVFRRYGLGSSDLTNVFIKPGLLAGSSMALAAASAAYWPDLVRTVQIGMAGPALYIVGVWYFEPSILSEIARRLAPGRGPALKAFRDRSILSVRRTFRRVVQVGRTSDVPWRETAGFSSDRRLPADVDRTTAQIPDIDQGSAIPRIIHQVFLSQSALPPAAAENIAQLKAVNIAWEHRLYDDAAATRFIAGHYGPAVLRRFERINPAYGAARADLLRYLLLYRFGGVYLDLKSGAARPLDEVLRPDDVYLLSHWRNGPSQIHEGFGLWSDVDACPGGEFQQWHIIAAPGHPFLRAVIESVLANIDAYDPWRHGTGGRGVLKLTGPIAYTKAIAPIRDRHRHRMLTSEDDVSLCYSLQDNAKRIQAATNHYTGRTDAITTQRGAKAVSAMIYSRVKRLSRWYRYRRLDRSSA